MDYRKLVVIVAVCETVGFASSLLSFTQLGTWYASLNKPAFTPPNWLFALVWVALYALMGLSLYLVLERQTKDTWRKTLLAVRLFAAQLTLNFLWSPIFFGLHHVTFAMAVVLALIVALAATIIKFWGISRTAAALLLPYLAWCFVAAALNYYFIVLN